MIKNIMPYHGTHFGNALSGITIPEISQQDMYMVDDALDIDTPAALWDAAEALAVIGKGHFKAKKYALAFAYYSQASAVMNDEIASTEYNAARALQELALQEESKGNDANAVEAAKMALVWFDNSVTTAGSNKDDKAKADAVAQVQYMKEYIKFLSDTQVADAGKKDPAKVTPKPKKQPVTTAPGGLDDGKVLTSGASSTNGILIAGAAALGLWLVLRSK